MTCCISVCSQLYIGEILEIITIPFSLFLNLILPQTETETQLESWCWLKWFRLHRQTSRKAAHVLVAKQDLKDDITKSAPATHLIATFLMCLLCFSA